MPKLMVLIGACLGLAAVPASAQSWSLGVGFGFGEPDYYGPPVYYGPPPVYYGPPPVYLYEQPPAVLYPTPVVPSAVSPDEVFDNLERAGYRDFSPMAFRDGAYKLDAVNRAGDFVALEVSALTGEVEREYLIEERQAATPAIAPRVAPELPPPASGEARDPLVVY